MKCKNKYLGEITEIILGGTPNTKNEDYWNGDIPWISVTDFSETKRVYETEKTITESGLNNSNTKLLNKGDIIATGTPFGVGPMNKGDEIVIEVEGIGRLRNSVK